MRTSILNGVKFTYPNEGVWSAERQIIYLERISGSVSEVKLSKRNKATLPFEDIATYKLDENGKCAIDITDLVRTFGVYQSAIDINTSLNISLATPGAFTSFYIRINGIINPAGVYIPPFKMPDALIVPPERILFAGLTDIRCEFYPAVTTGLTWELEGSAIWSEDKRWVDAIGDFDILRLKSEETTIARKSTFQSTIIDACKSPAVAVRWVSFTGVQRVHHFMLRKPTIASAENYQLLTLDNSYNEIKGRVDGLDLYLDDLLPYDLWYYADVITSSKVEVSLDGQTWNQVQVTNKNVTIPTGEMGNGKLEITVNWRKYDAVTM